WPHVYAEFLAVSEVQAISAQEPDAGMPLADFVPKLVRLAEPRLPEIFRQREQTTAGSSRVSQQQTETPIALTVDNIDTVIGILAHRYLEFVTKQGMESWPPSRIAILKPAMLTWLQRQGVKAEALQSAADRTVAMLQTTLQSEDGRWLLQPRESASA